MNKKTRFHILLVRPTRYDDEGYPIHWLRSALPSNSLACMLGIAHDCRDRNILGDDVEIVVEAFDESNYVMNAERHIRKIRSNGGRGLLALVGVQSNQFPRAVDVAQPFLAAGIPVCVGGFHVSGCLAMFKEPTPELVIAMDSGISLFAGEAEEGRFDQVVKDAFNGRLQRLYNLVADLPSLANQPLPMMATEHVQRSVTKAASIDLGRGCPFTCSFCCIINVQGRKSRFRTADDLERVVRHNYKIGAESMFITDDNFARNKNWESLLDKLIALKKEGIDMNFVIQVDTLCHRIPGFIEKCVEAGVDHVFIGLENINPENLLALNKKQNLITEYREMMLAWKRHPVILIAGYIIGLPNDTRESILADIDLIKRELPIDLLSLSILTPLPGSEDHKRMLEKGVWMDPDLNKYDLTHRVTHHPRISDEEFDLVFWDAMRNYYTYEHMVTILHRMFALGSNKRFRTIFALIGAIVAREHGIWSFDVGTFRIKPRKSRRPGMPLENPLFFYSKYLLHLIKSNITIAWSYHRLKQKMLRIDNDPDRLKYTDTAITPPTIEDVDKLALFNNTRGSQGVVLKFKQRFAQNNV